MLEPLRLPDPKQREVIERLNDYAVQLRAAGQRQTALVALRRGLAIDPLVPELWACLGCVEMELGHLDAALTATQKACALAPADPLNWGNLGVVYGARREYALAEAAFARCKATTTDPLRRLTADWDLSLQRLERGMWTQAWPDYEARIARRGPQFYPRAPCPLWEGESLDGKVLYVQMEQGFGDVILFSRYLAEIHRRWPTAKIKFSCHDKLVNLMWEFSEFVEFLPGGIPWPKDLDYASYLASLPRILGATPDTIPADPGLIRKRCEAIKPNFDFPQPHLQALKVGIAWTGNPTQDRNHERTIPLEKLMTLADDPGVCLYSFQVGEGSEAIQHLGAEQIVFPFGDVFEAEGMISAGAAMLHLDLMISVCTSTAHLAGALGIPTWTLLCHDPYWIWMQGDTRPTDTLWYPNMTLYNQPSPGDWDSVLARVKTDLTAFRATEQARTQSWGT